jgi:hypothetical protein
MVLNPLLYERLKQLFPSVLVARQGEAAAIEQLRGKNCVVHRGEAYRVSCFAPETPVATPVGDVPIKDLVGTAKLLVPNSAGLGLWRDVAVRHFGQQRLLTVHLKRRRTVKVVRATPSHRWVVRDRPGQSRLVTTADLVPGDRLGLCFHRNIASYGDKALVVAAIGVAQGFIFGDGSCSRIGRGSASVSIHSKSKDAALLPYFSSCRQRPERCRQHPRRRYIKICDLPRAWKKLPDATESLSFLLGWFAGYFAADGHVSPNGAGATLYSAKPSHLQFVKGICYQLGIRVSPIRPKRRRRVGCVPGGTKMPMYSLAFPVSDVPAAFWILKHHRERANRWHENAASKQRLHWIVDSVEDNGESDDVYCAVVPGVERFTLADNLLTMNCPFCVLKNPRNPDTRQRCWISHLWGVPDANGDQRWREIHCYHNDCFADWDCIRRLRSEVYTDRLLAQGNKMQEFMEQGEQPQPMPEETTYPGVCVPLDELPPDHPAVTYLRSRNFDPAYLTQQYGVRYCLQTTEEYPACLGRLIIPIYMDGKMRTWQGRYIGDVPKGSRIPKYVNQPRASKSRMLYGHDAALAAPFVTITEGVTNVWRLGSGAVAALGKHVSLAQYDLLRKWRAAIIALDPDAYYQSEDTYAKLGKMIPTVRVLLPEGQDPDSLGVAPFWELVVRAADEQGVMLPT